QLLVSSRNPGIQTSLSNPLVWGQSHSPHSRRLSRSFPILPGKVVSLNSKFSSSAALLQPTCGALFLALNSEYRQQACCQHFDNFYSIIKSAVDACWWGSPVELTAWRS